MNWETHVHNLYYPFLKPITFWMLPWRWVLKA